MVGVSLYSSLAQVRPGVGHPGCGRQPQRDPFPGQEALPPLGGRRSTMESTTRRRTVRRERVRVPGGAVGVPPRPGQDDGGAATRPGLRTCGARPPVLHSLRASVRRPRAASAEGALLSPGVIPPHGSWAWWRAGASHWGGGTGGQRPRLQQARGAFVGWAWRFTAGGCGTRGKVQHHPASTRGGRGPVRVWRPEGQSRQLEGRRGSVDGRPQGAAPCQVQCPTRACT